MLRHILCAVIRALLRADESVSYSAHIACVVFLRYLDVII